MTTPIAATAAVEIARPAGEVWAKLRRFGDLGWAGDAIAEVRLRETDEALIRDVRVAGSDELISERLVERDDDAMTFTYAVDGLMMGMADYVACCGVQAVDDSSCRVSWDCSASTTADSPSAGQETLEGMATGMAHLFAASFAG
ncbi:SRPBCC family protein [Candidatus Poriferisocius sp.]|uniref:SRPBCC family protein n=1 Tax=Candidatus Poriferisocius sp. TaxID=3101276 RepID=UPI003B5A4979